MLCGSRFYRIAEVGISVSGCGQDGIGEVLDIGWILVGHGHVLLAGLAFDFIIVSY
jgi:hypothetical protein